ncbi:MAG TPA: 50S ribosomal protein L17 [Clostridiales bacterium]|nr:50S ribosomal protein L17 [Clostridia bacterium]HCY51780.1 50S ribosomal protein L17 [Clostridiales bacterium]
MPRKLGVTTAQRKSMLRNLSSDLLWYGKITTTEDRAKEVRSYTEKLITLAMNTYSDNVETKKTETNSKGKEVTVTVIKDGPKKLAARRKLMASLFDLQEVKGFKETNSAFKARTKDINHPLIEKIFNEIAPKYAARKEELGQGGGYTRILKCGPRKGDAAEVAIIELV